MNQHPQYRLDTSILIFFLVVMLLGGTSFLYRYYTVTACPGIAFAVSADTIKAGEMVMFTNKTAGATRAQWDFGDNSPLEHKLHAGHTYRQPGTYTLRLTVNGSCTEYRQLVVQPERALVNLALLPKIGGPNTAAINELVRFKCLTEKADTYEWRFGESGRVDSRDKNPRYKFSSPGIKTVSLVINGNEKYIARQTIHVLTPEVRQPARQQALERRNAAAAAAAQQQPHIPNAPDDYARYDALKAAVQEKPSEKIKVLSNDELVEVIKQYAQGAVKASQFKNAFCDKMEQVLVEVNNSNKLVKFPEFLQAVQGRNLKVKNFRTIRAEGGCVQQIIIRYKK